MFEDVYCYKCGEFIITVEDGNVHQHICMDCVLKDIGGPEEDHLCEDKEDIMSKPTHMFQLESEERWKLIGQLSELLLEVEPESLEESLRVASESKIADVKSVIYDLFYRSLENLLTP